MPNRKYLTVEQVCDQLSVSSNTLLNWIQAKDLKAYKLGGAGWRIAEPDLREFLESRSNQKPNEKGDQSNDN